MPEETPYERGARRARKTTGSRTSHAPAADTTTGAADPPPEETPWQRGERRAREQRSTWTHR